MGEKPKVNRLLTTRDLAEYLRISMPTMYKWIKEGKAPRCYKVNRRILFKPAEVAAWIAEREKHS